MLPIEAYFPKVVPYSVAGAFGVLVLSVIGVLSAALLSGAGVQSSGRVAGGYMPEPAMFEPLEELGSNSPKPNDAIIDPEEVVFRQGKPDSSQPDIVTAEASLPEIDDVPPLAAEDPSAFGDETAQEETTVSSNSLAVRYASSVLAELDEARIVATSPGGDAGSRTVWMLGRSLARTGRKVMIIDLSGGGFTSQEMLGSNQLPGLFDMIVGNSAFENIVYRDRLSPAHVVPSGNLVPTNNPPDLDDVSIVIDTISEPYEFVLIDCGDTDTAGIEAMSSTTDIVVISGIGAKLPDCDALEKRIQARGYGEVIQIVPDSVDAEKEALVAA